MTKHRHNNITDPKYIFAFHVELFSEDVLKRTENSWKLNALIISYKLLVRVKLQPKIDQSAGMSQSYLHSLERINDFHFILVIVAFKNVALLA